MTAEDTRTAEKAPRRGVGGRLAMLLLIVAGVVAALALLLYVFLSLPLWESARAEDYLIVDNRTDHTLLVFFRQSNGDEFRMEGIYPPIPPHRSVESGDNCGSGRYVARTTDGHFVAERGPFDECNLEEWVIETSALS